MLINGIALILVISISYFLSLVIILQLHGLHTSSLLQKSSHRLGRKSKPQNVIIPSCASLKNWPDQSPVHFSFAFPQSGSRQHRSSTTMVAEGKPRRCFLVSPCFTLDSTASCLLSLRAYCRVRVTFVEVHKCHDCRYVYLSTSCSCSLCPHREIEPYQSASSGLSFNHQCCWVVTNVSDVV